MGYHLRAGHELKKTRKSRGESDDEFSEGSEPDILHGNTGTRGQAYRR
jgi:hypothetical protein